MARKIKTLKLLNVLTIFFVCIVFLSKAQNPMPIKEEFDNYSYLRIFQNSNPIYNYSPCDLPSNEDQDIFGDGMSFILDGYITMYKTTGDKAYLYKFIIQSLCMMENRHDFAGVNTEPRWSIRMYQDGYIIGAMARFVYFIQIEEPNLQSVPIFPFPEISGNSFSQPFNTFYDYANWLKLRLIESINWFHTQGYWAGNIGYKVDANSDRPAAINMQVGFGRALLFLGLVDNNPTYLLRAQIMANLFKGQHYLDDTCENQIYDEPVLRVKPNNSYWWYHKSWSVETQNCWTASWPFYHQNVESINLLTEYIEDISHGAVVASLPLDYFNFQPSTPFNTNDMVRFRNMFTKNIYDGNGGFFEAVDGTNGPIENPGNLDISALNYVPFEIYDGFDNTATAPNVYDIVMAYYQNNIYNSNGVPSSYGGMHIKGHAEVVKAQWEHECVNLSLYNRNVVYSQDFFVKNTLTIEPETFHNMVSSYAEPIINTPTFTVSSDVNAAFVAGESVIFKAGTHILPKTGNSEVHVFIEESSCTDGMRSVNSPGDDPRIHRRKAALANSQNKDVLEFRGENKTEKDALTNKNNSIKVYPNPSNGSFTIELENASTNSTFTVYSLLGNVVNSGKLENTITNVNMPLEKGFFILHITDNGKQFIHKIQLL